MTDRATLLSKIEQLDTDLYTAHKALVAFDDLAENNVYYSLSEGATKVEQKLAERASDDCEGYKQCGDREYTQEFMADGIVYIGKIIVEYIQSN